MEEVLHLLTSGGVSQVYEDDWGESEDSTFGGYMADLNGDCGNGYTHDWIDPSSDDCDGWCVPYKRRATTVARHDRATPRDHTHHRPTIFRPRYRNASPP